MHGHRDHLSNFLDVGRHIIFGLNNCSVLHNIHLLHDVGGLDVTQQNIAYA